MTGEQIFYLILYGMFALFMWAITRSDEPRSAPRDDSMTHRSDTTTTTEVKP